jgi:hypothetical protein
MRSLREKKIAACSKSFGRFISGRSSAGTNETAAMANSSIQPATQSPTLQALDRGAYSKGSFQGDHSKGVIPRGYVVKDAQLMPEIGSSLGLRIMRPVRARLFMLARADLN